MYCMTMIDLRRLAFDLVVRMNIAHSFDATSGLAGVDWARAFIRRHTTLTIRRPIATSIARMKGFNKEAVGMFFGQYWKLLVNDGFVPTRIWNCDETGFTTVAKPPKVVCTKSVQCRKGKKHHRSVLHERSWYVHPPSIRLSTQANG